MDLPSKKAYPDYFAVVHQPMAFHVIEVGTQREHFSFYSQKRIRSASHYDSIDKFAIDVNKIFENAMFYNVEGSQVHEDAKYLQVCRIITLKFDFPSI